MSAWVSECVQAFHWQSGWMMEQGWAASIMTNAYRHYQQTAGCTIAMLCTGAQPSPVSIHHAVYLLDNRRTMWEEQRKSQEGEVEPPLNRSIITPITYLCISQRARSKPEIIISISQNSLEIILLDWTNVLHRARVGVKGKETAI